VAQSAPETVTQPVYSGSHEDWMAQVGISQSDYQYVDYIIMHEGHWCPTIWNGEVGCPAYHGTNYYKAYGICQALEPSKMASAGADWETNVLTQLRWCNSYAIGRYGSWYGAYIHWINNGNW